MNGSSYMLPLNVRCPECHVAPGRDCRVAHEERRFKPRPRLPHQARSDFLTHVIEQLKSRVRISGELTRADMEVWNRVVGMGWAAYSAQQLQGNYGELYSNAFIRRNIYSISMIQKLEIELLKERLKGRTP